jgi:hypothetical protein
MRFPSTPFLAVPRGIDRRLDALLDLIGPWSRGSELGTSTADESHTAPAGGLAHPICLVPFFAQVGGFCESAVTRAVAFSF